MQINSVIIVGGGTAGWFTAAALAKCLPQLKISIIESKEIPTIGVGESTLGHITRFFKYYLGLKDEDWMKESDATYKVSIAFEDFYKKNSFFQYPFGKFFKKGNTSFHNHYQYLKLKALFPNNVKIEDYVHFLNYNSWLATHNRITEHAHDKFWEYSYSFSDNVAYHFDAEKFANYLKNNLCKNVQVYNGIVDEVKVNENGVEHLKLKDLKLNADLYIDCTGFNSIISEKSLGVKFKNFEYLPNDSAVTARIPYKNEEELKNITNTTLCKAMNAGWMWNIPLWHRSGNGYVYSSKYIDDDVAELEFRKKMNYDGETKLIKFRHGRLQKAFYKNVYAVGLSYGFVEPLESTGLLTVHENIIKLIDMLTQHDCDLNYADKEFINNHCEKNMYGFSNFILNHYTMSRRTDTEFWKYMSNHPASYKGNYYEKLEEHIIKAVSKTDIISEGMVCISIGMNYNPLKNIKYSVDNEQFLVYKNRLAQYNDFLKNTKEEILKLPTTYEFLKEKIYF